jgi:hypothetical protein
MNVLYDIEYIKERSGPSIYLFRVQIKINNDSYEDIVVYSPNQAKEFDFGSLKLVIQHLPKVHINTIKAQIRNTKL